MGKTNSINKYLSTSLIIILLILILLVFFQYFKKYQGMPPALDPYFFCAQSNNIIQTGNILDFSPDYVNQKNIYSPGFYVLISQISFFTKVLPLDVLFIIPLFSFLMIFLSLFVFFNTLQKNRRISTILLFLASLIIFSSFLIFRELMIGIPQGFLIFLIILSLAMLNKSKTEPIYFGVFAILFLGIWLFHYLSFIFVLAYLLLFLLFNRQKYSLKFTLLSLFVTGIILLPVIINSGAIAFFNPNFAEEFSLAPTPTDPFTISHLFLPYSLIIIGGFFSILAIFKRKYLEINIFYILGILFLFIVNINIFSMFSPYVKRIMLFLVLLTAITFPTNLFNLFNKNYTRLFKILVIFLICLFLTLNLFNYQDRAWSKYFDSQDKEIANYIQENETIIAFFPSNLFIQCILPKPTKNILRINLANDLFTFKDMPIPESVLNNTILVYNEEAIISSKRLFSSPNEQLFNEIILKWSVQEERYYNNKIHIYSKSSQNNLAPGVL